MTGLHCYFTNLRTTDSRMHQYHRAKVFKLPLATLNLCTSHTLWKTRSMSDVIERLLLPDRFNVHTIGNIDERTETQAHSSNRF